MLNSIRHLPEELIYGLVIAGVLLFQFMMKRIGPPVQQEPEPEQQFSYEDTDSEVVEQPLLAREIFLAPPVQDFRLSQSLASSGLSKIEQRRFSRQSLMRNRREVQNAIVISTILGPCRAYEPHDIK